MITEHEALEFCEQWLSAWTGNQPEALLAYYTPDACYLDPARPSGLTGHDAMRAYFTRLLAKNPDWVWTAEEVMPTADGFTLKWKAVVPGAGSEAVLYGLDIVEMRDNRIARNEVYFDPSAMRG